MVIGEEMKPRVTIQWDNSDAKSAYATVFNVIGSREEIVLLFGESSASETGQRTVKLSSRIVLNPPLSKRLLILLEKALRKHEDQYGPLQAEAPSPPGLPVTPHPLAGSLIGLVQELNVTYDFERSVKLSPAKMLGNRFLITIDKSDIEKNPHERILSICRKLNMPEDFLEVFRQNFSQANPIDFGFEADEETCIYKAYLDFLPKWKREGEARGKKPKTYLMFLGFKWDAFDNTKKALTKYTWSPSLSFEGIEERLSGIFEKSQNRGSLELVLEFLRVISIRTSHENVYYLDVTEGNSRRRSFDINAYSANLDLQEMYPLLTKIREHYFISGPEFHELYEQVKEKRFGHLSGGVDRKGNDFLTIYFGLEPVPSFSAHQPSKQ